MLTAGALHVFGERQLLAYKGAAGTQRPQHAKQQAVDMLGSDAADDAGVLEIFAPQGFQRLYFIGQLAQGLVDALGLAAGAGGAQAQLAVVQIEGGGTQGRLIQRVQVAGFDQPGIHGVGPALARLGLQVGGQQYARTGPPGAQQRNRQQAGVFQVHGQAPDTPGLEACGEAQGVLAQLRVIHEGLGGHPAILQWLKQQVLKFQPFHTRPRTLCRTSHSTANNRPINP